MNANMLKMLLLVAGILGILQGVMTLVGGIVAAEDKSTEDIAASLRNTKYACGFMRLKMKTGASCSIEASDRGWFRRVRDAIKDDVSTAGTNIDKDALKKLAGYELVLSYAVILGVCWMVAGGIALMSAMNGNNKLALIAGCIFGFFYLLFVAFFGAIWDSHLKIEDDCKPIFDSACSDVKDSLMRSSREFLGYSICAFVLILYCIIACFLAALTSDAQTGDASKGKSAPVDQSKVPLAPNPNPSGPAPAPPSQSAKPDDKAIAKAPTAGGNQDVIAVAPSQPASAETSRQFQQVNKYLADEPRLNKKVDAKFGQMDKDNSGSVAAAELESFVTEIMKKKKMPPPKPEAIALIVKKYDKDKSGKMEKGEFKLFLHDIYMMTRESLVRKYAKEKAPQLKPTKPPVTDTSGAKELEALLKTSAKFYEQLDVVAKEVDKDKSQKLSHAEVTDLCARFCTKYKVPTLTAPEISGIMKDMERPIGEYDVKDLRLAALAILSIAKDIVLLP